jgi:hypothetical protein
MDRALYTLEVRGLLRDQSAVDVMLTMLRQVRPLFVEPSREMVAEDIGSPASGGTDGA